MAINLKNTHSIDMAVLFCLDLHALKYPELELGDKREEISFSFFYLGNTGEQDENRFNIKV